MALDMTGPARHDRDVHYRRYLGNDGKPTVICVQDFDYHDYDRSRFLDLRAFSSKVEAQWALIDADDLIEAVVEADDRETAMQIIRNIRALDQWNTNR